MNNKFTFSEEELLTIWLTTNPSEKSPYMRNGHPPMWKTLEVNDMVLFTRPAKTMKRPYICEPYEEVNGISYQWQKDGKWIDQGYNCTFDWICVEGVRLP